MLLLLAYPSCLFGQNVDNLLFGFAQSFHLLPKTSFDVISPVSFSDFCRLLKEKFPGAEFLVILPKNARQIFSAE